ncbi:uncharacterized protein LOC141898912, partial [Tubulanus polymorphus]|uniref:uncharacterized protein LOC141898912 n=1 Tax=Tubulanus polymorphus TaxID=672921 RepID=UPI003DA4CC23
FLRNLEKTGQLDLVVKLTTYEREIGLMGKWQTRLASALADLYNFIQVQERRMGVKNSITDVTVVDYSAQTPDDIKILREVSGCVRDMIEQANRSKAVLAKLQEERTTVAERMAGKIDKMKTIESLVRKVLDSDHKKRVSKNSTTRNLIKSTEQEADFLLESIEDVVKKFQKETELYRLNEARCKMITERIIENVSGRRFVVERALRFQHKENDDQTPLSPRFYEGTAEGDILQNITTDRSLLVDELDNLERQLQHYMAAEKTLLARLSAATLHIKISKTNLEFSDTDLKSMEAEMRIASRETVGVIFKDLLNRVQIERKDTVLGLLEITNLIENRLVAFGKRPSKVKCQTRKKPKFHPDISLPKKVNVVMEYLKEYIGEEQKISQNFRAEFSKKRKEIEEKLFVEYRKVETLEAKIRTIEGERDKYKKLYESERAIKKLPTSSRVKRTNDTQVKDKLMIMIPCDTAEDATEVASKPKLCSTS